MAESNTFKYLSDAQSSNAATEFLQKQLGKNKYTSGDPYAYGEGATPGGEGYRDQLRVTNQDAIDQWHKDNPDGGKKAKEAVGDGSLTKTYGKLSDLGFDEARIEQIRAHAQSASGSGAFGYSSDTSHHFKETSDKTEAGSIEADMRKIGKHMGYEHWGTANPERIKKYIMEQEAEEAGEGPPKPEFKMDPIEHSPEIKQAKERVKNYEEDVMSGKTSQEIYGKGEQLADDKYIFDATKGAAGIGASPVSASQQGAADATQSFLNNKVSQVKKSLSPVN